MGPPWARARARARPCMGNPPELSDPQWTSHSSAAFKLALAACAPEGCGLCPVGWLWPGSPGSSGPRWVAGTPNARPGVGPLPGRPSLRHPLSRPWAGLQWPLRVYGCFHVVTDNSALNVPFEIPGMQPLSILCAKESQQSEGLCTEFRHELFSESYQACVQTVTLSLHFSTGTLSLSLGLCTPSSIQTSGPWSPSLP